MNIFVLNTNQMASASDLCDQHVVKMPIETAQMLCSAHHVLDNTVNAPYKNTHVNHPCTIWTRTSLNNYLWLVQYGLEMCYEYSYRYGSNKQHKAQKVIEWCRDNVPVNFSSLELTEFALAMPDIYKVDGDAIQSYRRFYLYDKVKFARWKYTKQPKWWWR
jgi:hypothetical protein